MTNQQYNYKQKNTYLHFYHDRVQTVTISYIYIYIYLEHISLEFLRHRVVGSYVPLALCAHSVLQGGRKMSMGACSKTHLY